MANAVYARALSLAAAAIVIAGLAVNVRGEDVSSGPPEGPTIEQLLARVPDGATWQDLDPGLRADLQKRASSVLVQDRKSWGLSGLQQKEDFIASSSTPAVAENIDRVLSVTFASELPDGFRMARDVQNAQLRRLLIKIYLVITDDRGFMLYDHPEFRGWDGLPVKELPLLDHEHVKAIAAWEQETEDRLRSLPDGDLTSLERRLRDKSYFTTRAGKHFDRPAVASNGVMPYSALYKLAASERPFTTDAALLDAYNASMFSEFREVNMGTVDAFMYDYESEFNEASLKAQGMSDELARNVLKLGNLLRTRIQALPEGSNRCTIFSPSQRDANWDAFTAGQIANAQGAETMQAYAKLYDRIAAQRLDTIQAIGRQTVEILFPDGSPELTPQQRTQVIEKLLRETRPAMMIDTLLAALDEVTGNALASTKVKDALANQPTVGGGYLPGEPVRDADRTEILTMWNKIRAFIKREYSGYRVDIAALIPAEPTIVTTGQNQFTLGGQVFLSLGSAWNLASFSSTLMHEIKHAIDQNSHAAVEGAASQGAAVSIEAQVWPIFIEQAMASQPALLPVARLKTEIDNVRSTATTDATLKIFLRESCGNDEPDTIAYAEGIVQSYGYTDPEVLRLRSRRAHRSTQYLEYDYGLAIYTDLLAYLQNGIGPTPRVDAYLLQACAMPSAQKNEAAIDNLRACIRDRRP